MQAVDGPSHLQSVDLASLQYRGSRTHPGKGKGKGKYSGLVSGQVRGGLGVSFRLVSGQVWLLLLQRRIVAELCYGFPLPEVAFVLPPDSPTAAAMSQPLLSTCRFLPHATPPMPPVAGGQDPSTIRNEPTRKNEPIRKNEPSGTRVSSRWMEDG